MRLSPDSRSNLTQPIEFERLLLPVKHRFTGTFIEREMPIDRNERNSGLSHDSLSNASPVR
jgi:hypothetical protein